MPRRHSRQRDRVAYGDIRDSDVPLVLLQHFRNLENCDPALLNALAAKQQVVSVDSVDVGVAWRDVCTLFHHFVT
jgi:hypothetical protein